MLILSLNNDKYAGRIYGGAIATIAVGLFLYLQVMRRGKKLVNLKYWKFCLPIALPLIFHNLSHLVLNQADKLMLQRVTTDAVVGIYGFTYKITLVHLQGWYVRLSADLTNLWKCRYCDSRGTLQPVSFLLLSNYTWLYVPHQAAGRLPQVLQAVYHYFPIS